MVHWHQPLAIACLMVSGSARGLGWDGGAVSSDDWVDSDDSEDSELTLTSDSDSNSDSELSDRGTRLPTWSVNGGVCKAMILWALTRRAQHTRLTGGIGYCTCRCGGKRQLQRQQ
jgi:hypothetical protein